MGDAEHIHNALLPGTELLRGQYRVIRAIGQGGFGLTYLAHDSLRRTVVIKECYPSQICTRDRVHVVPLDVQDQPYFAAILEQFQAEALRLAELDHPGIVAVHQTFAENGTAYTAMDFVEGVDLLDLVERAPGRLTRSTIDGLLRQVLDSLKYLHDRGILHRDVAPDNLILGEDGRVTLIDFGAAYASDENAGGQGRRMLAVKDGYSPPEFYSADGVQSASSDIYSLGALCHLIFTGDAPIDAQSRVEQIDSGMGDPFEKLELSGIDLDPRLLAVTDRALSIDPSDRPRGVAEWIAIMEGAIPKPLAEFNPEVISDIKDLVRDTNRVLTPGVPKVLQAETEALKTLKSAAIPKQYVDIFGDPIEDVDAYLKEQEQLCKARDKRAQKLLKQGDFSELDPSETSQKPAKSRVGIASALRRFRDSFKSDRDAPETRIFQA